jgi:membrane protease YdiL (CAAX protease family)
MRANGVPPPKMPSRNDSFPSVPQAAALLLVGFLLQYVISAALYDARRSLDLSTAQLSALVMLLGNGLLLAFVTHHRGTTYRDLLHPSPVSLWGTLLLLVPPVLLLVPGVMALDEALINGLQAMFPLSKWEEQAFEGMVSGGLGAVVATCVLAPVLEEMLFRGVLLRAFLMQHPRWAAISYSALFFGVAHLNIYQFALAFLLGLLLGWLFERSRSLIPCIALHAALNGWVVASAHLDAAEAPGPQRGASATWLLAAAAAVLGALLLKRLLGPVRRPNPADVASQAASRH